LGQIGAVELKEVAWGVEDATRGGGGGLPQAKLVTGLAITSTFPFGKSEAGPSATA
jgi:hypothetical protein